MDTGGRQPGPLARQGDVLPTTAAGPVPRRCERCNARRAGTAVVDGVEIALCPGCFADLADAIFAAA